MEHTALMRPGCVSETPQGEMPLFLPRQRKRSRLRVHTEPPGSLCRHRQAALPGDTSPGHSLAVFCSAECAADHSSTEILAGCFFISSLVCFLSIKDHGFKSLKSLSPISLSEWNLMFH